MPTITGTAGSETLTGGSDADIINDELGGDDILRGMGGNDTLHFWRPQNSPITVLRAEGGDGNDLLDYYVFNASTAVLDGGAGSDVFRIWAVAGSLEIVTGSGADILDFSTLNPTWGGQMVVTDFTGGVGGDRIVWDSPTFKLTQLFTGWNGSNPFASGYLKLTQVGADTVLSIDLDGAAGAQAAYTVLTFRSTLASSLTAWNFSGYDPNGGGVPGQSFTGTVGVDQLIGTDGEDILSGLDGDDFLQGRNSNDRLDGGAGNDMLNGGMGDDIVDGGAGNDQLSDPGNPGEGGGNDILMGGDGNDTISVSRWGGSTDRVQLYGGDGADELNIIGDPGFSALLDGGAGDDRIYLQGFIYGDLTVATGAGVDTVYMHRLENPTPTIRFTDFTAGAGGDILSWEPMLTSSLIGWNAYNPFQLGFARLVQEGGDVLLQLDRDGSGNAHGWTTLITFVSTVRTDFSAANFGYNPLVTAGQLFNGAGGNDVFNGTAGDDVMQSQGGNDILNGGDGDDDLQGGSGIDILAGGAGDDRLDGGQGGEGQATYVNGQYLPGGDVADYRSATRGVTVDLRVVGPQDTGQGMDRLEWIEDVYGSAFDDVLTGSRYESNLLMGFGGNDRLDGDFSNDVLVGGDGDDILTGGFGEDQLDGGEGLDKAVYDGPRSNYTITTGSDGVTTVRDNSPPNQADRLQGVERLQFSDGLYDITGAPFVNVINGTPNADTLVGTPGVDSIDGGSGNDVITGGLGNDTLTGGQGVDVAVFAGLSSAYTVSTSAGVTTVTGPDGVDTLTGIERLRFDDAVLIVGAGGGRYFAGTPGVDTITGTTFNDWIEAGAGGDIILAGDGSDVIYGDRDGLGGVFAGNDIIDGGAGIDWLYGDGGDDLLSGGDSVDYLYGGDGDDVLIGGAGADYGDGGDGFDTLDYSNFQYTDGRGFTINYYNQPSGPRAGLLSLTGFGGDAQNDIFLSIERLIGTGFDDTVFASNITTTEGVIAFGEGGNDALWGSKNADYFDGGWGADRLNGGDGDDMLVGGAGNDQLEGGSGSDTA
ncbi:MAG TPA: calcium-binding protein, partial [Brevundimonas sp.]|nr:calcium-binding protein [Brevundimonas sp.]